MLCRRQKMKKAWLLFLITITIFGEIFSKNRLPEVINNYQPSIFPVISPNGTELYFTRKWHPENTGGIYDDDDVWVSIRIDTNDWGKPIKLKENINTDKSNSLFFIYPNGKKALVYGDYLEKDSTSPHQKPTQCFALTRKTEKGWSKPGPMSIDDFHSKSKNYSASMSTDGRVIIMSLERDDSFGSLDLYISFYNPETGIYSKPKNLGNVINTKGVELVAFLAYDSKTLYFASNGRQGNGKLDLYLSRRLDDTWLNWSQPLSLEQINSEWDENSLSLSIGGDTAYFTSGDTIEKREGIYFTNLLENYRPLPYLIIQGNILTFDGKNSVLLKDTVIFKVDNFDTDFIFFDTITDGTYRFIVPNSTQYNFFVYSRKYEDISFSTSSSRISETSIQNYDFVLKRKETNQKLVGVFYFDTDIDTLGKSAIKELKKLCNELRTKKNMKILVVGHTDEIGTDEYNFQLSLSRAKNTAKLIASFLKIDEKSIEIQNKGKTEPVSNELSKNRRVEIFIIPNE